MADASQGRVISINVECGCCGLTQSISIDNVTIDTNPITELVEVFFRCIRCHEENIVEV